MQLNQARLGICYNQMVRQKNIINSQMEDVSSKKKIHCSMMESTFHFQQKLENNLSYHCVRTPFHRLQEQIQLYQWRRQHQNSFIAYEWTQIKPYDEKEVTIVLKSLQILKTLSNTTKIRTNQFIRKISKVFTAFKKLFERFGPFELSQQMIAFDSFYEPLVWMNSDHTKNQYKRDFISEEEFGQNILMLLLKYDSKLGVQGFAEHCCKVRGEKKSLQVLSAHFQSYDQGGLRQKMRKESQSSTSSQECVLSFSKISRTKKKNSLQNRSNKQISISYLGAEEQQKNKLFFTNVSENTQSTDNIKRNCSLITIKLPSEDLDHSFCFEETKNPEKITAFTDKTEKKPLTVSMNLDEESQEDAVKEIVELPQLDQYKRCLVKSIINKEGAIKDRF